MEHRTHNIKTIFAFLIAFISLVLADQASKYIIRHSGGFYVCNSNIAFGIELSPSIFWIFWIVIIGAIFWELWRELSRTPGVQERARFFALIGALVLILAGALGNMIDRMTWGCVVDFINWSNFLLGGMIWPVFNLADIFIVSGAFILLAKWRKM